MFIQIVEPVNIERLGQVLISGVVGATCGVRPQPTTIIKSVQFWYDDREPRDVKPEIWEHYESQLIEVLNSFADIEKHFKYEL